MKSKTIIFVTLLLLLSQSIFSQSKLNISAGGGYFISQPNSSSKLQYWGDGYTVFLSIEYMLKDNLSLSLNTSYQNHSFDKSLLYLTYPAVLGYGNTITGEDSKTYNLGITGRLYLSSSFIKPLVSFGTGVVIIEQGNITGTWLGISTNNISSVYTLMGSNNNYIMGEYNIGTGIEIRVRDNLNILVEGSLIGSYKSGLAYFPITTSIKFGL